MDDSGEDINEQAERERRRGQIDAIIAEAREAARRAFADPA